MSGTQMRGEGQNFSRAGRKSVLLIAANGDTFRSPSDMEDWILPNKQIPGRFFEDYPDGLFFRSDITFDFVMFDPANVGAGQSLEALIGKLTQKATC